jgi:hypothetical protein
MLYILFVFGFFILGVWVAGNLDCFIHLKLAMFVSRFFVTVSIIMFVLFVVIVPFKKIEAFLFSEKYANTINLLRATAEEQAKSNFARNYYSALFVDLEEINDKITDNRIMADNPFLGILYNKDIARFDFITVKNVYLDL